MKLYNMKTIHMSLCLLGSSMITAAPAKVEKFETTQKRITTDLKKNGLSCLQKNADHAFETLKDNVAEFVSISNNHDKKVFLNTFTTVIAQLLAIGKTIDGHIATKTMDAKSHKKLVDISTRIHIFCNGLCQVRALLENYNNSTSMLDLISFGGSLKEWVHLLPEEIRTYNEVQWYTALVHRFGCSA